MSDENKHCGCGNDCGSDCGHGHDHDESCENHNKSKCGEDDGCSCGGCGGGCGDRVIYIDEDEKAFLLKLAELPFLPLTQFVMKSSKSDHMESLALETVYLHEKNDTIETVKKTGAVLRALEDKHLITLDYDMPLQNGDYSLYEESELYRHFCDVVHDGGKQNGFLFDIPVLERGSMALTTLGQDALDSLE